MQPLVALMQLLGIEVTTHEPVLAHTGAINERAMYLPELGRIALLRQDMYFAPAKTLASQRWNNIRGRTSYLFTDGQIETCP